MIYTIYQVVNHRAVPYAFISWENAKSQFNPSDYKVVYRGSIECEDIEDSLDELFSLFNNRAPSDFSGRSIETSDVIELSGKDTLYFYCSGVDWIDVTEYFEKEEANGRS